MKNIVLSALIALSMSLVGCSNERTVSLTNSQICIDGTATSLTEFCGYEAYHDLGTKGKIYYYLCSGDIDNCMHNSAGVYEDDMLVYKNAKYYTLYHQTEVHMYYPIKGGYIESKASLVESDLLPASAVVEMMYKEAESMFLSEEMTSVDYEGILDVNVSNREFKMRPKEIIIPEVLRVTKDDGSVKGGSSTMVGETPVLKVSNTNYDYYQYNGTVIQIIAGFDISEYITFK